MFLAISCWLLEFSWFRLVSARLDFKSTPGAFLIAQLVKSPPPMLETPVWFLGREDLLEKGYLHTWSSWASLVAQLVKNPPAMWEPWVQSLGWEDPLDKGKATHSRILAWRILWTVQSIWSSRVGHDCVTFTCTHSEAWLQVHSQLWLWVTLWSFLHVFTVEPNLRSQAYNYLKKARLRVKAQPTEQVHLQTLLMSWTKECSFLWPKHITWQTPPRGSSERNCKGHRQGGVKYRKQ